MLVLHSCFHANPILVIQEFLLCCLSNSKESIYTSVWRVALWERFNNTMTTPGHWPGLKILDFLIHCSSVYSPSDHSPSHWGRGEHSRKKLINMKVMRSVVFSSTLGFSRFFCKKTCHACEAWSGSMGEGVVVMWCSLPKSNNSFAVSHVLIFSHRWVHKC